MKKNKNKNKGDFFWKNRTKPILKNPKKTAPEKTLGTF